MRYVLFSVLVIGIILYLANSYQKKRKDEFVEYANARVKSYNDAASQIETLTQMVRDSLLDENNELKLSGSGISSFYVKKLGRILDLKCFFHENNRFYKDSSKKGIGLVCNIWGDKFSSVVNSYYKPDINELSIALPMELRLISTGEYKFFDSNGFCKSSKFFFCGTLANDHFIPLNISKPKEIDSARFQRMRLIGERKYGTITFKEFPKGKIFESVSQLDSIELRDCVYEE